MKLYMPKNQSEQQFFDVVIIGGGASGTALLYMLAHYTDIGRIALIEKYPSVGSVNSNAKNNSQTLHVGDIETNYSTQKVKEVYPAAMMIKRYSDTLPEAERNDIIQTVQKMVLAVGSSEVEELERRYGGLKDIFPSLQKLDAEGIAKVEPEVMRGRDSKEPVLALFNPQGYAVNYGALAKSFSDNATRRGGERVSLFLGEEVKHIQKDGDTYLVTTEAHTFSAGVVVVDADAHSLGFAKRMGYGKEFSLIPIAGTFFFTPEKLRGKVYRVQDKRMPFAAVHGDPDLTKSGVTRWGPTARFYPVLEARNLGTSFAFFKNSGLHRLSTWISFISILLNPVRFWYLVKNFFYDLPFIGTYIFLPQVQKIVPGLREKDLRFAADYGGMRLQRVDTRTHELLLGEGKIIGMNIIFNMTPSPGASVSLYNAMRDVEQIMRFNTAFAFDKERVVADLCVARSHLSGNDVSLKETYAS